MQTLSKFCASWGPTCWYPLEGSVASTRIPEAMINSNSNKTRIRHFLNYLKHIHNVQDKLSPWPQSNRYSYKLDNLHCNLQYFDCPPIVMSMIALSIIQYSLCLMLSLISIKHCLKYNLLMILMSSKLTLVLLQHFLPSSKALGNSFGHSDNPVITRTEIQDKISGGFSLKQYLNLQK